MEDPSEPDRVREHDIRPSFESRKKEKKYQAV